MIMLDSPTTFNYEFSTISGKLAYYLIIIDYAND